jgi:hypothetical protein
LHRDLTSARKKHDIVKEQPFPKTEQIDKGAVCRIGTDLDMDYSRILDVERRLDAPAEDRRPLEVEAASPLTLHNRLEDFVHLAVAELPLKHP